jgi:hypothetical protein
MAIVAMAWPTALVLSSAIAGCAAVLTVFVWQVFAVVVRDDRRREERLAER